MFTLLTHGHVSTCPALYSGKIEICEKNCEGKRYVVTGILSLIAALAEGGFGFFKSLSLFSDGVHASADGAGDFVGAWAAKKARRCPHEEATARKRGNKAIAVLLGISAVWVIFESFERMLGAYEVDPLFMITLPFVALCIHFLRFRILHGSPFKNETLSGILMHVKGDILITLLVIVVGIISLGASVIHVNPKWFDLPFSVLLSLYLGVYLAPKIWSAKAHHHH